MRKSLFEDEGYKLMGVAFEVANHWGYGMAEEIYQQSLEIEMGMRGISFATKPKSIAKYKEQILDTKYTPDLIVLGGIIVELKAIPDLVTDHDAQLDELHEDRASAVGRPDQLRKARPITMEKISDFGFGILKNVGA